MSVRHPEHDAVATEVASWYTTSAPAMGYLLETRWCGLFTTPASVLGPRVILRLPGDASIDQAIVEVRSAFGDEEVEIWIEGRADSDRRQSTLEEAGCSLHARTLYLALVGRLQASAGPEGLQIEDVGEDTLAEWVTAHHQGFAESEDPPLPEEVARQLDVRRIEMGGVGRLWNARMAGEVVATLAFYEGHDRLVNSLATRVPYRGRGIAQALLAAFADDTEARGCRSALINADADDWPVSLYRRMGFANEILYHGRFKLPPVTP